MEAYESLDGTFRHLEPVILDASMCSRRDAWSCISSARPYPNSILQSIA